MSNFWWQCGPKNRADAAVPDSSYFELKSNIVYRVTKGGGRFCMGREDWRFDGGVARRQQPPVVGCFGHPDGKNSYSLVHIQGSMDSINSSR
jgi:hypothetical protein